MTIALICGGGILPRQVAAALAISKQRFCVARLAGEVDVELDLPSGTAVETFGWGQVGRFLKFVKANEVQSIVAVGGVTKRPDFAALKLDLTGVKLLPRLIKMMRGGDDHVLSTVSQILKEYGIGIVSVLDIAPELACPAGPITIATPQPIAQLDIDLAYRAADAAGVLDMGQGAIAANNRVIGIEGPEGTRGLIARAAELKATGRAKWGKGQGVLVKRLKPDQDMRFDLPVIGPDTIDQIADANLAGIAVEAGHVLLLDKDELIERANTRKIFIIGVLSA